MTIKPERRREVILGGVLAAILIVSVYMNSGSDTPTPTRRAVPAAAPSVPEAAAKQPARAQRQSNGEFRPRVLGSRPDDKFDVHNIDPALRLDLLAKVEAVPPISAGRNLFQFGQAPPPPKPLAAVPSGVPPIRVNQPPPTPVQPLVTGPVGPPPPAPINLKYYGSIISKADGAKTGFLLDGEDILIVRENQTVKQRYRIVKITQNTIDIEDIPAKNTQTLRMPPDAPPV